MDNQQLTVLTLLGFSNIFNTVDYWYCWVLLAYHCQLLIGCEATCMSVGSVFAMTLQFLRGVAGVPQGCALSPLLFSITNFFIPALYRWLQIYSQATLMVFLMSLVQITVILRRFSIEVTRLVSKSIVPRYLCIIIGGPWFVSRIDPGLLCLPSYLMVFKSPYKIPLETLGSPSIKVWCATLRSLKKRS